MGNNNRKNRQMERMNEMIKKIVLGTLLVGLIGILVAGGVIRTLDKTENVAEAQGKGYGSGWAEAGDVVDEAEARGQGNGRGRSAEATTLGSDSKGYGQDANAAERQYPNFEAPSGEQIVHSGTVVQEPADGVDLIIKTDSGTEVKVGTGPGYMQAQGFSLQVGDQVQVKGFFEDEELKATQVTRLADGQTITLRDEAGRPAWSGSGQRAVEQQALVGQGGRGQGGAGRGSAGGRGQAEAPGDGTGTGQAQVDGWLDVQGKVSSVTSGALIVQTTVGQEIAIEGRAWRFVQEQAFQVQVGDSLTLTGFYEGEDLEIGKIENDASGKTVLIREENGRPLWAGGGRRGG